MFLTAQLVFTIFMLAAEKHRATFIAPIGIGLSLFIAELMGVYYTGGSLNPARSFGPCVILGKFNGYHWIYWVGPVLGALLASGFYLFIKALEYETVNPESDAHAEGGVKFDPETGKEKRIDMDPLSSPTLSPSPVPGAHRSSDEQTLAFGRGPSMEAGNNTPLPLLPKKDASSA
jgi:aquaporin rerated protein, other eukaryote